MYAWAEHIQYWLSLFGKDQVKILILEEWHERPEQAAQECYRFIGVDHSFMPQGQWLNSALAPGIITHSNSFTLQRKQLNVSGQNRSLYPVNWLARRHYHYCHTLFEKQKITKSRYRQLIVHKFPFRIFYSSPPNTPNLSLIHI